MASHDMLPGRRLTIAVASGKGGTGKTLVATNLAVAIARTGVPTTLVDCDVEAPNDALFLPPDAPETREVTVPLATVDQSACTSCGACRDACAYGAIRLLGGTVVFAELCNGCGLCATVCPTSAISEAPRPVGEVEWGSVPLGVAGPGGVKMVTGRLEIGDVKATNVIRAARRRARVLSRSVDILDAPPGVACSAVAATHGADMLVLVTEPTQFGLHDLDLAVRLGKELRIPIGVVINRDGAGGTDLDAYLAGAGVPILARIPFDRSIAEAYADGGLVLDAHPDAPGWFDAIWDGIAQMTVEAE
ncbi:MAG: ATP-binding protein [Actinomycetia bacterium]|nr:ATP-binding protein [Actinomycetes bacterium]